MSSYGHFILEVKQKEGWKRIRWKSERNLYTYRSNNEDKNKDKDYTHNYVTVSQFYRMRDSLKQEEFGHTGKSENIQQAIYDEVRKISAKLNGEDFKKDKKENIPFDEYYEEDLEWLQEEINSLNYLSCIFYFMVDETCGYTNTSDIRIIVVAG